MSLGLFKVSIGFIGTALWLLESVSATTQFAFHVTTDVERSNFVNSPVSLTSDSEFYEFKWPIRKVAIIGAGVSGLLAYRELVDAGFEHVKIFERDAIPGGIWHYTDETPVEAPIPNDDPKIADYEPSLPPQGSVLPLERWYMDHNDSITTAERWRRHRAPHGVWKSLTTNVPAPLMHFNGLPYPPGTPWHIPQAMVVRYIRSAYSFFGINSNDGNRNVSYSTRVELVEKRFDEDGNEEGWTLTLKQFIRLGPSSCKERWWTEDFDAVVIATGTFNAPNIPNIPGLADWSGRFPGSIVHSREYRHPEKFSNRSVLMVGAGTSATGISADINPFVKRNYLSLRRSPNSTTPLDFLQLLPQGVQIVAGIDRFHASNSTIQLSDGTFLTDIDNIIFATGYQYTFPFLPQYHNSSIGLHEEGPKGRPQPLVTDGSHYRSLYRDFIYIEEPTLGFMNMNLNTNTWDFGEYFAVALAKVWSGTARLPNEEAMWKAYRKAIAERGGYGKGVLYFSFREYITFFCAWLNGAALEFGGKTVNGLDPEFFEIMRTFLTAFFANRNPVKIPLNHSDGFMSTTGGQPELSRFLDYMFGTY
ncbi:Dimethylaniline monooxygenase [Mycena sanguinolenta]|uniref:Dimethylaniline monooxygenase n=1 Tax=Mycena sanguinolenta TaxID=230812 RepID=A0A8H7DJI1_9AGAR|nr:Dimethylaniline monooxygenase [Mycena sanguinolenta]